MNFKSCFDLSRTGNGCAEWSQRAQSAWYRPVSKEVKLQARREGARPQATADFRHASTDLADSQADAYTSDGITAENVDTGWQYGRPIETVAHRSEKQRLTPVRADLSIGHLTSCGDRFDL
jgi:hypothetical protein